MVGQNRITCIKDMVSEVMLKHGERFRSMSILLRLLVFWWQLLREVSSLSIPESVDLVGLLDAY